MERIKKMLSGVRGGIGWLIWKPREPGEEKLQINTKRLLIVVALATLIFTAVALVAPAPAKYVGEFHEKLDTQERGEAEAAREHDIVKATEMTQRAFSFAGGGGGTQQGRRGSSGSDRNSSMILNRPGINAGNQLPAGTKFIVRLMDKVTIGNQAVPVIAEVTRGFLNDNGGGITEGSRLFGSAQFQNGAERAVIQFQSIASPSGLVRNIQGIAIGTDGQAGVNGNIRSNSMKNTAGQFASRFIGAYASGSQQRDFLGNSRGGAKNGLLNAVSETAQDRSNAYAEDLKKEHQWIEIPLDTEVTVILTQTFTFKEPGVSQ